MARSLEQKLSTLEGLQRQIDKHLRDLDNDEVHFTLYRTKEELHQLLLEIEKLNKMMNALAHAVAVSTDDKTSPGWMNEAYEDWADHNKTRWGLA